MTITELYTPEELEIYEDGFRASKRGLKLESNPYDSIEDDRQFSIWQMGYFDFYYE